MTSDTDDLVEASRMRSAQKRALIFLSGAAFAAAATTRIMDAVLPQVALEFQVPVGSIAFVATAYAFAYGAFQIVFGPLGDRYGKYRIILFATLASALTAYACALSSSLSSLAVARLVSGMVAAAIVPLSIAWVGDMAPPDERQQILARFMSGQILGLLAGQVSGGLMGEMFGWRSSFVVIGSIYLLAFGGLMTEARANLSAASGSSTTLGKVLKAFAGLAGQPNVRFVLAMVSVEAFAMFGAFTYVGAILHDRFGISFAMVGAVLATYCIGGLAYVFKSRLLIGLLGNRRLAGLGATMVALSYVAMALSDALWLWIAAVAFMGLGFYMLHNTLQTLATEMAPEARGSAVSMFATCYFLSQAIGVYFAGKVLDLYGASAVFLSAAFIVLILGLYLLLRMPAIFDRPPVKVGQPR